MKLQDIKLIIGLGNPDEKYEKTCHNAGFLFIDYLNNQQPIKIKTLKSDVFMNESGIFIAKIIKKTKLKPEEILIIHDDSDIELGKYKFSFGRGSAGHNGVESIIKSLKTKNFWRLRIGIRPKVSNIKDQVSRKKAGLPAETQRAKAGDFVLKKINKKDFDVLEKVFEIILKNKISQ
ncbi:peptidyl-tRNA hydrolase [Candidatus Wolfebacteria bacterium]|nr:peptidyl-tRNA hydrolase [Candidatus Wolfebacteria bacterium]